MTVPIASWTRPKASSDDERSLSEIMALLA
jgi:hypothetical protein